MADKVINTAISSLARNSDAPDRMKVGRIGLMGMSLGFVMSAQPGNKVPWFFAAVLFVLALFVPRFKVLGWWLTSVITVLVMSIALGQGVAYWRQFSGAPMPDGVVRVLIQIGLVVASGAVALIGLFAKGTRQGVERRTNAVLPGTF